MCTASSFKKIFLPFTLLCLYASATGQQQTGNPLVETADSLLWQGDNQEVLDWVDHSISPATDATTSVLLRNRKAEALIRLGKYRDAGELVAAIDNTLTQIPDDTVLTAITNTTQGFLDLNEGRNDHALSLLQKALDQFNESGEDNTLEGAQALSYLGQVYIATGKNTQAEEQLQMALNIRSNLLPENHELIAASLNDLGFVYSFLDYDKALDYYDKALKMYQALHGEQSPKIAIANTNIGAVYVKMELYGDAVVNLEKALSTWEKIYPGPHPAKGFVLFNLGRTYQQMGNLDAALGYYNRALDDYQKSYGAKHPEIAAVYNAIGNIDKVRGKYDEALAQFQDAMVANIPLFENHDVLADPPVNAYYNGYTLLYSLMYKAQTYEARHFGKTLRFSDLSRALRCLSLCDTLIDRLRQQSVNEADKISLGAISNEVYGDGVRISYTMADIGWRKSYYRERCFYFAEKSKSAVLLASISDSEAKSYAHIPADLLEQERSLKAAIALCAQQLAQKPAQEEENYLRETQFSLDRDYQDFVARLEKDYPQYYNLKFNTASPSIADLQNILDDHTAVISYFIDEKNNRLYTFVVTKNRFKIQDHLQSKNMDRIYTGYRNSIYFKEKSTYVSTATTLYDELIPTIPEQITELIIVPTGRMSVIPFEAFLTRHVSADVPYNSMPYLVLRYKILYDFSAGLLLEENKSGNKAPDPSIFLCAPVDFEDREGLSDLPGTEKEVSGIADLFENKHINFQLSTENNANEEVVKSPALRKFSILHFATHGVVDEAHPELSRIFLQSSGSEDGDLYSGEIYNLDLDASLVTLSACETGLGKISRGEGVIGLSRALVYAGAQRLIVSFWSVADESTALLMNDFYKNLIDQFNPAESPSALQRAKLDMIREAKYAEPYYWAPFVLIGK